MSKFKVGDYVIFKDMHKVADMLNTSFYDVLTSVYEITGTEGRCYLMKSDNGRGRVWKIRKSRIDRLGIKVVFTGNGWQKTDGECKREHEVFEWQGFHLVPKSGAKIGKQRSHDLFEEAIAPWASKHIDEFERMRKKCEKKALAEIYRAKKEADAANRKELADEFIKGVESLIKDMTDTMDALCRMFTVKNNPNQAE